MVTKEFLDENYEFEQAAGDRYCSIACHYGSTKYGVFRGKEMMVVNCARGYEPEGCAQQCFFSCPQGIIKAEIIADYFINTNPLTYYVFSGSDLSYQTAIINFVEKISDWRTLGGIAVSTTAEGSIFYQAMKRKQAS